MTSERFQPSGFDLMVWDATWGELTEEELVAITHEGGRLDNPRPLQALKELRRRYPERYPTPTGFMPPRNRWRDDFDDR